MAPSHGLAQGLLAFGQVRPAPAEHGQGRVEAGQQGCRGQDPGAGCGQLDRQRQMVEPPADPAHDLRVGPGRDRTGLGGALHEQFGRRWGRQRRDRVHLLGLQAKG
jgi:hypothetical protein